MTVRWMSAQIALRTVSSGASNQASRNCSSRGLVGQPGYAALPLPRIATWTAGSARSIAGVVVRNTDQPPRSSGSCDVRRRSTVAQSDEASSMLKSNRRNRSAATAAIALVDGTSVGASRRMSCLL